MMIEVVSPLRVVLFRWWSVPGETAAASRENVLQPAAE